MSAIDDFAALLSDTEVMKQTLVILRKEPAYLLAEICREYERNNRQPIPDHRLSSTGYLGEAAIKALLTAGLVKRQSGGMTSLYVYEPSAEGLKWWDKLKAEGFYQR